eukprot:5460003-Prymnesium_polylepis.1
MKAGALRRGGGGAARSSPPVRHALGVFDQGHESGTLTGDEIVRALTMPQGERPLTVEQAKAFLGKCDASSDGTFDCGRRAGRRARRASR